jgi:hypothetical protein
MPDYTILSTLEGKKRYYSMTLITQTSPKRSKGIIRRRYVANELFEMV